MCTPRNPVAPRPGFGPLPEINLSAPKLTSVISPQYLQACLTLAMSSPNTTEQSGSKHGIRHQDSEGPRHGTRPEIFSAVIGDPVVPEGPRHGIRPTGLAY